MATPVDIGTLIERTPGTVGGRPRIAGTRVPVSSIAGHWARGLSPDKMIEEWYPHLNLAQVHAALSYYFANRPEIDDFLEEEEREFEAGPPQVRPGYVLRETRDSPDQPNSA